MLYGAVKSKIANVNLELGLTESQTGRIEDVFRRWGRRELLQLGSEFTVNH
jgi:hypothetical protein